MAYPLTNSINSLNPKTLNTIFTVVDNPASNGLNERLNQMLVNRIRCKINETGAGLAWTRIAHDCVSDYNRTVHSSTGFTPEYLMFGKLNPVSPLPTFSAYSLDLKKAFQKSQISHMRNKRRVDSGKREISFKEGDTVYSISGMETN